MIHYQLEDIQLLLAQILWPLFRVAGILMVMPIFGTQLVPMRVRAFFAILVTLLIAPIIPPGPTVDLISIPSMVIIAQQVLIGLLMGFALQLFFHLFAVAGQMISMQMGLGFASLNDPANGVNVAAVGQFFLILCSLLFLAMNGHHVVFEVLVESFRTIPIGQFVPFHHFIELVMWFSWIFASALLIALPVVIAMLIVNIAFGVMTKAAPQLNVFALGFPISMIFGLFVTWVGVSSGLLAQYSRFTEAALFMLRSLIQP
ncbi:flagellar type III secretion system protein FliR [Endozoicomonas sp. SM1973]|uniref:Flagellar biosynthetic protein FliR n=1 Tax=Spartinivicinus marinus TaxID=2994442 RepID=A0A853I204_9GAMM|nr:flagellar biosynthetic protein FliR [Spartinivicinus marinus]MCX4028925.1 flagellar biosynthetic protein FliR [Spartinivicinus marinus]NYZ65492.1 flagellar type III secretion system protein FliR [Spartinivicinus marinus]